MKNRLRRVGDATLRAAGRIPAAAVEYFAERRDDAINQIPRRIK